MRPMVLLAGVMACGTPSPDARQADSPAQADPPPADSLAVRLSAGVEVWFLSGRSARDSSGRGCYERTIEIRDSAGRRRVPLLYTLEAPTRLDDTSVRAIVYRNCQPGDRYRVSLRTGRPTPLGG